MMNSILSIMFTLFFLCACSGADQNAPATPQNNNPAATTGLQQNAGQGVDKDTAFASGVVDLLLGGALKGQLTYEQLPTMPNLQAKAASISVGVEAESSTFEKELSFPSIYLTASGAYERIQSEGAAGPVYYLDPISINLVFNNLTRQIDGQDVVLDGNLHCEVEGHYTVESQKFLGEGFCTTESLEGDTITVVADGKTSVIRLDATLEIHGEALNLESILPSGNILINDSGYVIEDLP